MKTKENKGFQHADHPKPITRRDFLAQGIIEMSGLVMVPGILHGLLHSEPALAAECGGLPRAGMIPFLVFDCAGGAALSGNWLVGKAGGPTDYLSSYDQMGIPTTPQAGEATNNQFGVPMFSNLSKVYAGILAGTSAGARANLRMATVCTASQDDSANNTLSALGLVSKTGAMGTHLASGVGTSNSLSGGRSKGVLDDPAMKPLAIGTVNTLLGALSYGPSLDPLPITQKAALSKAIRSLSASQAAKFQGRTLGQQFAALAECGLIKNADYIDNSVASQATDPRLNADATAVYSLTPAQTTGTAIPTIVFNVLQGNTGPGAIVIGGCDYHDGTQTTGDAKDLQIGTEIGRAVELASRLGRKLFFAVISDGSIYSDKGTRIWRGDAGSKGIAVMGYFDPAGPPAQRQLQLGFFKEGQGVERTTYLGNDPQKAACAIFANYLSACGITGEFARYVEGRKFDPARIDEHLVFG